MATQPAMMAAPATSPARGSRPRTASSSEAAPAPTPNPASTQPMPAAPQPRASASRVSPTFNGPTKPRSPRAMATISGASTRCRRMYRSPALRSPQGVPAVPGVPSSGSSRTRTDTRSGTDSAMSSPATVNAAGAPPAATASPPSGAPTTLAKRIARPRMPWTRASWSFSARRAGSAPTAGMNTASTVPKASASRASGHSPGLVRYSRAATARTAAQRTASLPMTTRRGPNRSATTPPPSISTALGSALADITSPACAGLPAWTAAQDRAR
ncbi:hypothetical protein SCANM63S_09442 [Streptomyces canarius]